jgi:hypothetical protein
VSHFPINLMSRSSVPTIVIGVAGAAWLVRNDAQILQLHSVAWQEHQAPRQAIASLLNRLHIVRSSDVQWVVAPSLLKHWLQQPPDHIQSLNELHAVTQQRAQQLFGTVYAAGANDHVSSWVVSADWQVSQPFLCGAVPASWHAAWMGDADVADIHTTSKKSSSIASPLQLILSRFQKQLPSDGWLSVVVACTLYLMYFKGKKCLHFRSLQLETALKAEALQAIALVEWQRDKLRTQLNSDQLYWLCLMPVVTASKTSSALLKPLQWNSVNTVELRDVDSSVSLGHQTDARIELSEVKLTAWSAWQCVQKQL